MIADKFRTTKRRSLHGSFMIYDAFSDSDRPQDDDERRRKSIKTNVDPVGHLMGKLNTGVFVVNHEDYANLTSHDDIMTEYYLEESSGSMTREGGDKALAYIEAVSQLPHFESESHTDGDIFTRDPYSVVGMDMTVYTSDTHWNESSERQRLDNIVWFSNSWTGYSWGKEQAPPPCFWTKDFTDLDANDAHTVMWREYDKKYPDRGWRIGYDTFNTYDMVLNALVDFLNMHVGEVHVWVQGTLDDMGPYQMMKQLQEDIHPAFNDYMAGRAEAKNFWKIDVSKSQDVFSYYASRPPQRIPVVPFRVCNMGMREYPNQKPQVFPASTWLREIAKPEAPRAVDVIVLPAGTGKSTYAKAMPKHFVDIDDIVDATTNKPAMKAMRAEALTTGSWDRVNAKNGELFAEALTMYPQDVIFLVHDEKMFGGKVNVRVLGSAKLTESEMLAIAARRDKEDQQWGEATRFNWKTSNAPIMTRKAINAMMGKILNTRAAAKAKGKATSLLGKGLTTDDLDSATFSENTVYTNYSGYVKMIPIWKHDKVDYSWKEIRPNEYVMVANGSAPGLSGYLLKVANPKFFMGMGSVATSQHSAFGLGRSENELFNQTLRKLRTGVGSSGHMIAFPLCNTSHGLHYLQEVFNNLKTKTSIYLMPFNEPAGSEYHTIEEYRNALTDMEIIINNGGYPKYAQAHIAFCRLLLDHFT